TLAGSAPRARAAFQRMSGSALRSASRAAASSAEAAGGRAISRLTSGMAFHHGDDLARNVFDRPDGPGTAVFHEFSGHAPDHRGALGFGDGLSAFPINPGHRIGSVAAHAGQHDADQPARLIVIERAADETLDARMPGIVLLCRDRHGAQAGGAARHDKDGIAAPD